ncbi:MAG: homocysteine S-methyltransferase family protein [Roseobacter sp.]
MPQLSSDKSITRKAATVAPGRTANLVNSNTDLFLVYIGMETDLIFTRGIDLPGFASYPLLETEDGRALLKEYLRNLIDLGRVEGTGVILESPTWVANRDRAAPLGYSPAQLRYFNQQAVELMDEVRSKARDVPTLISANLGPRDDAYAPADQMNADQAEHYHSEQISALSETAVDVVSAYTLAYSAEAIGIVQAAQRFDLPVVISFTVEKDGRLPTGETLAGAITAVDTATNAYTTYFMINCAHPDHFTKTLVDEPWVQRVKGIVANASRCSHAELDEAEELDDGNPRELGEQLADIKRRFPHIRVLGGCCGTDMRHMKCIAEASKS